MADDNEGLFSPEQEEWIKEPVSGLQRQREPPPADTTGQGSSSGVGSVTEKLVRAKLVRPDHFWMQKLVRPDQIRST